MIEKNPPKKEHGEISSETNSSPTNSRRSFLTKAIVAAPLLTTISSRPVWAGQCSLSGNLSNNVSNHDDTPCTMWGYSGGAWCNGHANNNDFWSLVSLTKASSLSLLLTTESFPEEAKIGDALNCNDCKETGNPSERVPCPVGDDDFDYANLGKHQNEKGLWKQRAVAALNLLLWEAMVADYDQGNGCLPSGYGYDMVHADFYFFTTLSIIMSADESILKNANRDGFPEDQFQTTCN